MPGTSVSKTIYPALPTTLLLISTKSYFSPSRTLPYLRALLDGSNNALPPANSSLLLALIPDFLTIYPCAELLKAQSHSPPTVALNSTWPIHLGAQDCFWETDYGPYTGEIVPNALQELGVSIVELGHAERRKMLAETDATTAKKAAAVCVCGMIPLVCVGEISAPPAGGPMSMAVGNALREVGPQVVSVLKAVPLDAPVILAYEPVWAIGAAKPADVQYVGPVVQAIRELVKGVHGRMADTKIVYGGSAGPGLWKEGGLGKWVDGMFLGRFAHEISGVQKVVQEVLEERVGT